MQLSFDLPGGSPLTEAQGRLLSRFGPQRAEQRHDPITQLVTACLCARTRDEIGAIAVERLAARFPDWSQLISADAQEVEAIIAEVSFPELKAPRLIKALRRIHAYARSLSLDFLAGWSADAAMDWLVRLPGVGFRNAAAVVNFSTLRGYAFVLDAHTLRVAQRLGWVSRHANSAEKAYEPLMALIPPEWDADDLYEMHWLMKRLGQSTCKHAKPNCPECPLRSMCAFYLRSRPEPASDSHERDAEIRDRAH